MSKRPTAHKTGFLDYVKLRHADQLSFVFYADSESFYLTEKFALLLFLGAHFSAFCDIKHQEK